MASALPPAILTRRMLLLAFVAAVAVEQWLGGHAASLPLIRLAPALLVGGLLTLPLRERWSFAALALVWQVLVMRLSHPALSGWAILTVGLCTLTMGLCGMARLLRRVQPMRDHMGLRAMLDLAAAAFLVAVPVGLAHATLGQGVRAVAPGALLFGYVAPIALGMVVVIPWLLLRGNGAVAVGTGRLHAFGPWRGAILLGPALAACLTFVWPEVGVSALVPVAMVAVTLELTLKEALLSLTIAAMAANAIGALAAHGVMADLGQAGNFTMRARWFAWCAAQIALNAAMGSIRREGSHTARLFGQASAMLSALPDAVFRVDMDGRWQWLSPGWQALHGTHPADMVGDLMLASMAPRHRHQVQQAMDRILIHGEGACRMNVSLQGSDGRHQDVELSMAPMRDRTGGLAGIGGAITPMRELAVKLAAARRAETRWHELCDAAPVGIVRADLNGQITYANWAAELTALTGREHLLGMTLADWLGDADAFAAQTLTRQLDVPGAQIERELAMSDSGGRRHWLAVVVTAKFDGAGRRISYVAAVTDITARRQLEQDLIEARRRAEEAAAAKSAFLANISHEIRTPMNGVLGLTELLLERDLDDTSRHYARLISESGATMMHLLNGVLDLAKLDSGRLTFAQDVVDLRRLLEDSLALMGAPATRKGLETRLDIAPGMPALMIGDRLRMRQILANLIGNAVKFTETGGITVSAWSENGTLRITVADTGIGIAPGDQASVFEEFVQSGHGTQKVLGTGLGLPITRRLVSAMGGRIWLESTVGTGTTMHLAFDARLSEDRRGAPCAPAPTPARDQPEHALNILIAEDNRTNQIIATGMVQRLGHAATVAADGSQAVAMVMEGIEAGRPYDLVLMDMLMPVMDGLEATRALRAAGVGPEHAPIIAVTANAFEEDVAACLSAGMQGHLAKPLQLARLSEVIDQVWSGQAARPERRIA